MSEPDVTLPFTCPICGAKSWNPHDAENRYCGRCHRFVDEKPEPARHERRYPIAYRVDAKADRTASELRARDEGGCDGLVLISLIFRQDGSRSQVTVSADGRSGGELSSRELFESWVLLAHSLKDEQTLSPAKRELCAIVFEAIRQTKVSGAHPTPIQLIRDRALEAAAQACEAVALAEDLTREVSLSVPGALSAMRAAERCARDIRAMKGTLDRDTDALIRRIEGELPPEWEQDGPDHWGCWRGDLPGRIHLSVWPRSDGRWVWEVFQVERDADTPAGSGDEDSFDAAKGAAIKAAVAMPPTLKGG